MFDLARVASDRGDADRGLSLLRRAGTSPDDHLVTLLMHFRPAERSDIGRNQPCWCGSGRKYKVCHRRREQASLDERAAWLYQKAGIYLSDGPWRERVLEVASVRAAHSPDSAGVPRARPARGVEPDRGSAAKTPANDNRESTISRGINARFRGLPTRDPNEVRIRSSQPRFSLLDRASARSTRTR